MNLLLILVLQSTLIALAVGQYETVCYQGIGCFTNEPPWGDTAQRPTDLLPKDPDDINTRFYLDTKRQSDHQIYNDNITSISESTFDVTKPTRIIIHGFVDAGDIKWMTEMSETFLDRADENVIRVIWVEEKVRMVYEEGAVDTQVVGAETGVLVNNMISSFRMSESQFHCIGHSLGAHACSYVGDRVYGLGRISGLDPAGPYFEGASDAVRLDDTDASFVDVIHTDADKLKDFGIGTAQQSGDVDFWPNDGIEQPGCDKNPISTVVDGIFDGSRDYVACNHERAVHLFIESIMTTCPFKAYPCINYADYLAGKCLTCDGTGCPQLGFYADLYKGQVDLSQTYLQTNGESPFCEYMTYIVVHLGENSKKIKGELYITLHGPNGSSEQEQMGGNRNWYTLTPGGYYNEMVYYDVNPGGIDYITLLWKQDEIEFGKNYITVQEVTVWSGPTQEQFYFCGDVGIQLQEKNEHMLPSC